MSVGDNAVSKPVKFWRHINPGDVNNSCLLKQPRRNKEKVKISLNMAVAHHNPIIPGFAPDPSICLIDGTFYLVNSSFHLYPGLPIYMSNDLVSWKHLGKTFYSEST